MKYLAILLCLSGCALNPADESLRQQLQVANNKLVNTFNITEAKPFPYPRIELEECGDCYAERSFRTIYVDPILCRQDMDDCLKDTLPHEDAHIAEQFYFPQFTKYNHEDTHDEKWCDLMREFGGVPGKHGYCH